MPKMVWLRLYTEITWDHKLRRLPPAQRWLWIAMMCVAGKSPRPGWLYLAEGVPAKLEDLADEAAINVKEVKAALAMFEQQHMIEFVEGVWHLLNWNKRQFSSDLSTDRTRKWRQRERHSDVTETSQERSREHSGDVPGTKLEHQSDVTGTHSDTDTDTEEERSKRKKTSTASVKADAPSQLPAPSLPEQQLLSILQGIAGYPFDESKDLEFIRQLAEDFPDIDILAEAKAWRTYKLDRPLEKKSNARSQFRNWVSKSKQFKRVRDAPRQDRDDDDQSRNPIYRDLTEEAMREAEELGWPLEQEDEL